MPKKAKAKAKATNRITIGDAVAVERSDLDWLLSTIDNANSLIVSAGMDDDEESDEIKTQVEELRTKYGVR